MTSREGEKQPVAYGTLASHATSPYLDHLNGCLRDETGLIVGRMSGRIGEALMTAYMAGLRDGFQQGVEAECKAREADDD